MQINMLFHFSEITILKTQLIALWVRKVTLTGCSILLRQIDELCCRVVTPINCGFSRALNFRDVGFCLSIHDRRPCYMDLYKFIARVYEGEHPKVCYSVIKCFVDFSYEKLWERKPCFFQNLFCSLGWASNCRVIYSL